MTGFLRGPLETLKKKELAVLLRALLDRYPVIVFGDSASAADFVTETLISLVPHRREVVFGSDFVSHAEHEQMIIHEKSDYNAERMVYRAPSSATPLTPQQISEFTGWVLATSANDFPKIHTTMASRTTCLVGLRLQDGVLSLEISGNGKCLSNTDFEQKLLAKVVSETRKKIERIKRVLVRAAQGKVSERLEKSLIDLHHEEERIRQSLFREQIQAFVQGAWRVLVILLRLRLLEGVGIKSVISDKMLSQAIDYSTAPITRLMEFIQAEWNEDFRSAVEGGRKRNIGDRLEGFWAI